MQKQKKTVRIGIQIRRAITLLPYIYAHYLEMYPNVHLSFAEEYNDGLVSLYQAGKLDLMVGIDTGELQDATCVDLGEEYIVLVVHKDNPVVQYAWQKPGSTVPAI